MIDEIKLCFELGVITLDMIRRTAMLNCTSDQFYKMLLKILNVSQPSTDTRLLARDLKLSHALSSGGREGSFSVKLCTGSRRP